jgi:ankyrin repeat protein
MNEWTVGETSPLIDRSQPVLLAMREFGSRTNTDSPDVSDTDAKLNTALHRAVLSFCGCGNSAVSYRRLDILMNSHKTQLNEPNKEGYTAIGCAVEHRNKNCVKRMLKHPLKTFLHLDYYPGDRESTVREIIRETYPDLEPLLPAPLMENLDACNIDKKLLAALQLNEYEVFCQCFNRNRRNPSYNEPYHSSLLEIACQMENRKQFVKYLLGNGVNANIKNDVTGMPLIHATARSGNFEILQLLLKKEETDTSLKDDKDRTILHWLAQVRERKQGDECILENCFKLLLHKHVDTETASDCGDFPGNNLCKKGIDDRDSSGNTALYIAVERQFWNRAKLLLSEGADVSVLGNACTVLLPNVSSILEEVVEDCLTSNDEIITSKNLLLRLNYQLLKRIVQTISESKHLREFLKQPVISTFLFLNWLNVRFIFFLDMAFYFIFLCFLTIYILFSEPYSTLNNAGAADNTTHSFGFNDSYIESGINNSNIISQKNNIVLFFLWLSLMGFLILLTLREMLQLIVHKRMYVVSLENWLEVLLIIATFISCSGVADSAELKIHSSAVALLLGWFEMLMMLGRLPQFSVQLEMLRTVSLTFLKYMMGYVTLLIAFALSFYILFRGSSEQSGVKMYSNFPTSLLKTIVMFTGELEASYLPLNTFPYTSHVIFLLFVVLVAIVLLNLLNGLAVNDTGEIRKNAETVSLSARAKLIYKIKKLVKPLPKFMKPDIEPKQEMFEIYPNKPNRIGYKAAQSLLRIVNEKTKRREKEKPTASQKEWCMFKKKLSELECGQKRLEDKLNSMLDEYRQISK